MLGRRTDSALAGPSHALRVLESLARVSSGPPLEPLLNLSLRHH